MSRLEIAWPDEAVERIHAARGRLARAGRELRRCPQDERIERVARVLGDWTRADSPWRRELASVLASETGFAEPTVREGLDAALRAWEPDAFRNCARRELAAAAGGRTLVPFASTLVLPGGAIPMPTMLSALAPLVVGSPVLLRESAKDPSTAGLLQRSIRARDEALARAIEGVGFDAEDDAALRVALEAECVVATGSDETIRAIRDRLRPSQRFVAYGHRVSFVVLGPTLARDESLRRKAAEGVALDTARWDQTGCLSPVVVYLVGLPRETRRQLAVEISQALEALSQSLPRGDSPAGTRAAHAHERSEALMRETADRCRVFSGTDHTVVLEADAAPRPAPLGRFLRLHPVPSLEALADALEPVSAQLSCAGVAGFETGSLEVHALGLSRTSVSLVTRPGAMQTPPVDWAHDGFPVFTPLARFVSPGI